MKLQESKSKARNASPALKESPKKTHKRNKSETDISWYPSTKIENKKDPEFSKLYGNEQKCLTLEDYFFDLECQMENNLICRDGVCIDIDTEKGKCNKTKVFFLPNSSIIFLDFLCEIIEILLYILLPDEDFHCKPLRYLLREIFSNCVILPLFSLLSDPDYINQAIIWLVCLYLLYHVSINDASI